MAVIPEGVMRRFVAKRSDFSMEDRVARGSWSTVYRGTDLRQNPPRPVAVEVFRNDREEDNRMMTRELSVMSELQHEGVMSLLAVVPPDAPGEETMLVFPWMEHGNLGDALRRERKGNAEVGWGATKKSIVTFGTAVAMAYVHSKNVLHRDLKPDNIFLNEYFEPVVGDFFCSRFEDVDMTMYVGSPLFMAPELIDDAYGGYTKSIDVYAYGVTLFQIFSDSIVLDRGTGRIRAPQQLMLNVMRGARLARVPGIPDCLWDLICSCWAHKPEDRPTFVEIVERLRDSTDWIFPGTDLDMLREYQERIVQGVDI